MLRNTIATVALASVPIGLAPGISVAGQSADILPARFGEFGHYSDKMEIRLGGLAYDRGFFFPTTSSAAPSSMANFFSARPNFWPP
jgi:hypothetical protein